MPQLSPDMPIWKRIELIAEALAKVLDRGPEMSVEANVSCAGDLAVYVIREPFDDGRVAHPIDAIARELEVLL